jgi:hypothetical protein
VPPVNVVPEKFVKTPPMLNVLVKATEKVPLLVLVTVPLYWRNCSVPDSTCTAPELLKTRLFAIQACSVVVPVPADFWVAFGERGCVRNYDK